MLLNFAFPHIRYVNRYAPYIMRNVSVLAMVLNYGSSEMNTEVNAGGYFVTNTGIEP